MNRKNDITYIYSKYVDDLYTYAVYLGFEKNEIMDAIHDVFYKLAMDINLIESVNNVKYYLFRSLKHRLIDISRSKRNNVGIDVLDYEDNNQFDFVVNIEDLLISSEKQKLIKSQIEEMLSSLTDKQREIIYLRYIQEYDYQQISELLNITVHGCRKLVSKAMKNLREKYGLFVLILLLN